MHLMRMCEGVLIIIIINGRVPGVQFECGGWAAITLSMYGEGVD